MMKHNNTLFGCLVWYICRNNVYLLYHLLDVCHLRVHPETEGSENPIRTCGGNTLQEVLCVPSLFIYKMKHMKTYS